ncbi:hypothetical protein E4U43_006114 [Claviceps pusilla]|uniref:Uncharacterized protein n=1 Tax=Claviceps pusilla TaxID=123648 RepID=A0A9P7STP4_9HYPO|nr:hypothetical protein E4U43_006114 [Claviceps pusilla]
MEPEIAPVDTKMSSEADVSLPQTSTPWLLTVALYHRDHYSTGHYRQLFKYEAFHWGLLITPQVSIGKDCFAADATDRSGYNPVTMRMDNPTMSWWINHRVVDPAASSKLLGRIVIGEIPGEISFDDFQELLDKVPLPEKNQHPQQSCVTWAVSAIVEMQKLGWARQFDIDQFKDAALAYADDRNKFDAATEPKVKYYKV